MNKRVIWTFISLVSIITLAIYWSTAYQTITWWDNSSYPIAANCLGVESPPGSLILTIIGWIVLKLTFFEPKVFALNLFAGLLAVGTIVQLFYIALLLLKKTYPKQKVHSLSLVGLSFGIMTFAFSVTFWTYAIQFTPYMLTTCMTAVILYQLIRFWFEEDRQKVVFLVLVIAFLIGLDFSIHRTNALLVPGFIGIIFLKDIKLFLKLKFWLYGIVGLFAGLAVHLLKIPMASTNPIVNFNNPNTLSRFYDYVSLKQYGGGFLTNVFTRKAPVFSVQTMDYIDSFYNNFISIDSPLTIVSVCTGLIALVGIYFLFKANKKTALMLLMLYVVTTVTTIFYFNIQENFFRTFTRHYLPSFVLFSIFISYGASVIFTSLKENSKTIKIGKILLIVILFLMPLNQILRNYKTLDGSRDSFASDYANNILDTLRPNAILFVMGDVFYPIFYMQQVEGKRTDIDIISISLTNTQWYDKQLMSDHYNLPLSLTEDEILKIRPMAWSDTTIEIPFDGNIKEYQLASVDSIQSVPIQIKPTYADKYIMGQDLFVLKLLEQNKWKRPIYFTQPLDWLKDFFRPEGLVWQLVPQSPADLNTEILQRNLIENYSYHGYAKSNRPLGFTSKMIGNNLWNTFLQLAMYQKQIGDIESSQATIAFVKKHIPLERVVRSEKSMERYTNILKQLEQ